MGNGYPRVPTDGLDELRIALQKQSDRITELERPNGSQINTSVAELLARSSLWKHSISSLSFSATTGQSSTGASVTVTLDKPRIMLIQTKTLVNLAVASGSGTRSVQADHGFWVDGDDKDMASTGVSVNGTVAYSSGSVSTLVGLHLYGLDAGTHTIETYWQGTVTGSGISGTFTWADLLVTGLNVIS